MSLTRASGHLRRIEVEETNRPNLAAYLGDMGPVIPAQASGWNAVAPSTRMAIFAAGGAAIGYGATKSAKLAAIGAIAGFVAGLLSHQYNLPVPGAVGG